MRYFFIAQDTNLSHTIQYRDFDIFGGRHLFIREDANQLNDVVALYLTGNGNGIFSSVR